MLAAEEDRLPDEELLAQMAYVGFVPAMCVYMAEFIVARSL